MMFLSRIVLVLVVVAIGSVHSIGAASSSDEIPPELLRWRDWVLHGHESQLCPSAYNDGALVRCQWPSRLNIRATANGGRFEQRWLLFARGWVALPGGPELWPDGVLVDGRPVAVVDRDNTPSVELSAGDHRIEGRFEWRQIPEGMRVPPASGLIDLKVDGQRISSPVIDARGRLWMKERRSAAGEEDRIKVQVFRLINDTIPMQVTTLLRMDVSGQAREIRFKDLLLANVVPMELKSPLPARMDRDGQLLVQARPGRWEIRIKGRLPDTVTRLGVGAAVHGDEVWSFQPRHHLRMVEVEGVPQVEPDQTELPSAWRQYSAYLIKPKAVMRFKVLRRGDPDPVPDRLSLHRRWWLDFDGRGFTLNDKIEGTLSRQWYLAMKRPAVLGRVAVDGKDQVITAQGVDQQAGVELRRGQLRLASDARLSRGRGPLNAVGWDHDFHKVSAELYLPPGWRILATSGVDQASDTWLQQWSLLDFFMVLIIALAVLKLRNWRWSVLALAVMVLIFHEPGAPRLVWLHILAALALMPLLPDGWIKRLVAFWGAGAVVVLLVLAIPFVANQMRWGIYPQLGPHNDYRPMPRDAMRPSQPPPAQTVPEEAADRKAKSSLRRLGRAPSKEKMEVAAQPDTSAKAVWHQDPDALIPTGPGLPDWRWHGIRLQWNGPVAADQTMRLYLLSPWVNLVLALLRVGLLGLMVWGVIDWRPWWQKIKPQLVMGTAAVLCLFVMIQAQPAHAENGAGGFPPDEMLEALRERLLAPPDCLPHCADISRIEVVISDDELQVMLKAHAADRTSIPLPANRKSWSPQQIMMDNAPISGLSRDERGGLWAVIPAGLHTIVMKGSVSGAGVVQLPLPLKPHMATYSADGWSLKGILPDGRVGSSLLLTRLRESGAGRQATRDNGPLPSFMHVERVLRLGLTWQVHTTVQRITPAGASIVANLPLLDNEALTTADLHVDDGQVLINMSADQRRIAFRSTLKATPKIKLTAPRAVPWTETWVLDASPIWHCDLEGIAVIHHQDRAGQWQPRWQPWPGESVTINIQRPKALEGQVVTIEAADMALTPGQRFSRGELQLKINSSRGGPHTMQLPAKANLQGVLVAGRSLPIRQDGQWVTVPLQPGIQTVTVQWQQLAPFKNFLKTPQVKIGETAVNAKVSIKMPRTRWILVTGGPRWGPAVLFWSYLAVIILVALGLGRQSLTPLKTWQWVLLGLGLTQIPAPMALIIVGWLLVLGLRRQRSMPAHWLGFNALQLGLFIWTLVALMALFAAVKAGLIGQPEMQVAGNRSSQWILNWTQDRIGADMPRPWVFSLPLWCYRGMMLAWSFWLAFALLNWLKWGWHCFAQDGVWRKMPRRQKRKASASVEPPNTTSTE